MSQKSQGTQRSQKSQRTDPNQLQNDEDYSNSTYNRLLPMSVHAREMRYTHNSLSVIYYIQYQRNAVYCIHMHCIRRTNFFIKYTLLCLTLDQGIGTRVLLQDMFDIHNSKPYM